MTLTVQVLLASLVLTLVTAGFLRASDDKSPAEHFWGVGFLLFLAVSFVSFCWWLESGLFAVARAAVMR